MSIGLAEAPFIGMANAQPEIDWLSMDDLPKVAVSQDQLGWAGTGTPEATPHFRLLHGSVEFAYDPDDRPTRKLIPAREDPEVL